MMWFCLLYVWMWMGGGYWCFRGRLFGNMDWVR